MKLLVTGGAGFIGSNFIHYWLRKYPRDFIINLDKLTYCGNLDNLKDISKSPNYHFEKFDITCPVISKNAKVEEEYGRFDKNEFQKLKDWIGDSDVVVHFAAESHVDRSVLFAGPDRPDAFDFVVTNTWGTHIMLEAAVKAWRKSDGTYDSNKRFHHISTDEVFGALSLEDPNKFNEKTVYNPRSPYAASKAGADLLVRAYNVSFGLPTTISNTSNNFGPYMYPEKLLPLAITNLIEGKKVPIYGDGKYVRDWLFVEDHCRAIDLILSKGKVGESYCIGAMHEEINNLELINKVLAIMGKNEKDLEYVKDRPGHDRRYAVDSSKAHRDLGYEPLHDFETDLKFMINWYQTNEWWWKPIKSGAFKEYYRQQYEQR